jgi:hypothetical protein
VRLAEQRGLEVFDLFHETKLAFAAPINASRLVALSRHRNGNRACMYHHHTDESIWLAFDDSDIICSTILRDPVDRFISEIFHSQAFLRLSSESSDFVKYFVEQWGSDYVGALLDDRMDSHRLLDIASKVSFFPNYYTSFFGGLLDMCPPGVERAWRGATAIRNVRELADRMRNRFAEIGRFDCLQDSFARTAQLFNLSDKSERLDLHINRRAQDVNLSNADRRRYNRIFHFDYHLLEELGLVSPVRSANAA